MYLVQEQKLSAHLAPFFEEMSAQLEANFSTQELEMLWRCFKFSTFRRPSKVVGPAAKRTSMDACEDFETQKMMMINMVSPNYFEETKEEEELEKRVFRIPLQEMENQTMIYSQQVSQEKILTTRRSPWSRRKASEDNLSFRLGKEPTPRHEQHIKSYKWKESLQHYQLQFEHYTRRKRLRRITAPGNQSNKQTDCGRTITRLEDSKSKMGDLSVKTGDSSVPKLLLTRLGTAETKLGLPRGHSHRRSQTSRLGQSK